MQLAVASHVNCWPGAPGEFEESPGGSDELPGGSEELPGGSEESGQVNCTGHDSKISIA